MRSRMPSASETRTADGALRIRGASSRVGGRTLWRGLDLDVEPGEFLAVLGPNGAGKSTLLRSILGLVPLDEGRIDLPRGRRRVGYVPQQRPFAPDTPLRARDLVRLGIDGPRFGLPLPSRRAREGVDALLAEVGARAFRDAPVGRLSGGEQQRVRIAQSLAGDPALLLADEPFLSLDLQHQRAVAGLLERVRHDRGAAVVLVTHDVNPVLGMVDRVLYLAPGGHRIGSPDGVLRSEVLTELYGTPVDVLRSRGRIVVVAGAEDPGHPHGLRASAVDDEAAGA